MTFSIYVVRAIVLAIFVLGSIDASSRFKRDENRELSQISGSRPIENTDGDNASVQSAASTNGRFNLRSSITGRDRISPSTYELALARRGPLTRAQRAAIAEMESIVKENSDENEEHSTNSVSKLQSVDIVCGSDCLLEVPIGVPKFSQQKTKSSSYEESSGSSIKQVVDVNSFSMASTDAVKDKHSFGFNPKELYCYKASYKPNYDKKHNAHVFPAHCSSNQCLHHQLNDADSTCSSSEINSSNGSTCKSSSINQKTELINTLAGNESEQVSKSNGSESCESSSIYCSKNVISSSSSSSPSKISSSSTSSSSTSSSSKSSRSTLSSSTSSSSTSSSSKSYKQGDSTTCIDDGYVFLDEVQVNKREEKALQSKYIDCRILKNGKPCPNCTWKFTIKQSNSTARMSDRHN